MFAIAAAAGFEADASFEAVDSAGIAVVVVAVRVV